MSSPETDAPHYAMLLSRLTSSGQWDRALDTAQEWLAKDPEKVRAHMAAATALINLRRHGEAAPHLGRVLASEPENDMAHRFMSIVHFHQNRFKAADESIQKAISLNPNDAFHWYHLALMFYRQGDRASGRKCAVKACALNPRNSDILNLLALCDSTPSSATGSRKLEQYRLALELDPENPKVHNNIGIYYLNSKDYPAAEEHFRRALFFDPTLTVARANLFITIKHSDAVYRCLCAPKDILRRSFSLMRSARKRSVLLYLLAIPVWILAYRFVIVGLVLWGLFVWPLVKVYEFLTIGDMRAQAGEIGARRGGFLGYRRWTIRVRLAVCALILTLFWGGMAWLYSNETTRPIVYLFIAILVVSFLVRTVSLTLKKDRARAHARTRAKKLGNLLDPAGPKRKWWKYYRE